MKRVISVIFLVLLGALFFTSTLRGEFGNPETIDSLRRLNAETKPFESSHERAPYAEMLAIKNRGTIELGKELAQFASPDVGFTGDRYYSFFPSGASYAALGLYTIGSQFNVGQLSAYASSSVFSILSMVFIYLIVTQIFKRQNWAGMLASLTYAFATVSWSYSISIYQHAAAAFFAVFLFYSAWQYKQTKESKSGWIWASLFWTGLGSALFFDYPNAIILLPLCIYFFINAFNITNNKITSKISFHLPFLITSVFFIGLVFLNGHRNLQNFGSPTRFGNSLTRFTQDVEKARDLAATSSASIKNKADTTSVSKDNSGILQEQFIANSGSTLLFGIDKGLFLFSPILILAIFGIITALRKTSLELVVAFATILSNLFVYVSFGDPWGGWAYGPRYLVPLMTFSSIFAVLWITKGRLVLIRRAVFFLFFAASSAIALAGPLTTNLIPPKVEADYLKIPFYNFLRAFDLLAKNQTGNFIYNTYLRNSLTLYEYFYIIWGSLLGTVAILLFIVPLFEKDHESNI